MKTSNFKTLLRFVGLLLIAEGGLMLLSLVPSWHFHDGFAGKFFACGLFTAAVGGFLVNIFGKYRTFEDRRMAFVLVPALWVVVALFGTLPYLATGTFISFHDALFETMSGFTTTGATVVQRVQVLSASVLFYRSLTQWIGGFGIVLLVLALVPRLGISKYVLYTAAATDADVNGRVSVPPQETVRRMLVVYLFLTFLFIYLFCRTGMQFWDAVNLTFTNISSGGFSIYNDGVAALTHGQQYLLALLMLLSGVNFLVLYMFFSFRWKNLKGRLEQVRFYLGVALGAVIFCACSLHFKMGFTFSDSLRMATVQSVSVITTTGTLVADTSTWWMPINFLFIILAVCGGMAGSTTGGLKIMRILILLRNVRTSIYNQFHPHEVNPVRLNGVPVARSVINNVLVLFFIYLFSIVIGVLLLMLSGVDSTQAIGAMVANITGYGPGLGASGGFGTYMALPVAAKYICIVAMLLGRLECLTVILLFIPRFWRG